MTKNTRLADALAIGVLAAAALIAALTFRDYGLGWDDFTHAQYGELLLQFYASGFRDTRAFTFVNLYMYGGGFDMAAALIAKALPFDLFEMRRLLGAAVGLIGLVAVWRLGRRIGGSAAGLVALVLLASCPLFYGHMFVNPKDGPFAAMMAVALLGTVRAIEEYPQPAPATALLLGLGFGLSVGSRIMGVFAVIYALAALALMVAVEARSHGGHGQQAAVRLKGFLRAIVPSVLIGIAAMAVVWPWSVFDPRNLPRAVLYFSQFFEKPWRELYAGELILATEMPRSYVPMLFGLKLPEVFLALATGGLIWALVIAARPRIPVRRRAAFLCIALAASLPIAIAVATRPAMYNGIRHFVFVVPPMAVLGGVLAAELLDLAKQYGRPLQIAAIAVLILGIASPLVEMVRLHPYQYVYYNRFIGGIRGAEGRYMLDYWGLAFKQAAQALLRVVAERGLRPEGRWKIAICGPHPPAEVVLGETFEATWDPKGADFAMMLGAFYCRTFDAPLLAEIEREGVVFARVYDIRGRTFDSLFTIPPLERE